MPNEPLASMTDDEVRTHLRLTCKMLAVRHHRKHNPTAGADAANAFAERNWSQFRGAALDFLSIAEADRQAPAAAPLN